MPTPSRIYLAFSQPKTPGSKNSKPRSTAQEPWQMNLFVSHRLAEKIERLRQLDAPAASEVEAVVDRLIARYAQKGPRQ